ncbi:MAG: thiamine pyrophosphate-binding protein [Nocardioidaceae bacterium]
MHVSARVAQTLKADGVDTVFGVMGDGNLHHLVAFIEQGGRFVTTLSESGAVSMADGMARTTRRIGVASVTHGPGMTNALTALTEAVRARSPLLLLTGDTASTTDRLQRFDLRGAVALTGAEYVRVVGPDTVARQLSAAMSRVATSSTPAVVDVPVAIALGMGAPAAPVRGATVPLFEPSEEDLDEALGIIATARRPVLLAGRGAAESEAQAEILRVADAIGAPVATTLLARGLFSGEPYDLGICGTLGHPDALDVLVESDCVIAFGASLNRFTTLDGSIVSGRPVVQNDRDTAAVGRYAPVTAALIGDARLTAQAMGDLLETAEPTRSGWRERRLESIDLSGPAVDMHSSAGDHALDLADAMLLLDQLLPRDRLVVSDTGRFIYTAWRHLGVKAPGDFVHTLNFASIGLGVATGVGVSLAHPDRLTVVVAGDGEA